MYLKVAFEGKAAEKMCHCVRAAPSLQLAGNDLNSISNLMGKGCHVCCRVTADKCAHLQWLGSLSKIFVPEDHSG